MTGKTHAAFGMASSLLILGSLYDSPASMITGLAISGIAAAIPDIDLGSKNSNKVMLKAGRLLPMFVLIITGIEDSMNRQLFSINLLNLVLGIAVMFTLFFFGVKSPHRGFTHSILAIVLFGFSAYLIIGNYATWFIVSYASHILLDLLNKKKVQLLFPTHLGDVCLKVCSADGMTNKIIGLLGTIIILLCFGSNMMGNIYF